MWLIFKTRCFTGELKARKPFGRYRRLPSGNTVVLAEGLAKAIIVNTKGWQKRTVAESQTESVVRARGKALQRIFAPTRRF